MQQDHWFSSANILQMIYIFFTMVFSCLIWLATRAGAKSAKAATEASKASLSLAKELNEKQKKIEAQLRTQYRSDVYAKSIIILDSATKLRQQITSQEVAKLPMSFEVGNEEAAKYFNDYEQGLIQKGKANIQLIRRDLFKNGAPNFMINEENKKRFDAMYEIFSELVEKLDKAKAPL